jgi:PAS domain S-box-containing protein
MRKPDRYVASLTDEGRARLLLEAVTDYAIYMLTPDGYVSSWNPGAARLKGYSAAEAVGIHFSAFYSLEDREARVPGSALRTAAAEGRIQMEGWRVRKDGSRFWALVVIDAIRDPDGDLVGFAKITRDLTERQEAQLALEQAREALLQSQKLEAIGQLTGGVAHDFNNLLMAILSSLELAKRRLGPRTDVSVLLDNAESAARRGVSLTERMLSFARRKTLAVGPIELKSLIHGMRDLLERALGPSVSIHIDVGADLQRVLGDADQLELAILNLAVNSRDAMTEGGSIRLRA